jgi:hypothetical protein
MRIFGKTLIDYIHVSWKFLAALVLIMAIVVFLRLSFDFPSIIQTLFSLAAVVFLGLAGWHSVRNKRFNVKQALVVGILLSSGIHWTLPLFHNAKEVLSLLLINTVVYSVIVFCGAWLATKLAKQRS